MGTFRQFLQETPYNGGNLDVMKIAKEFSKNALKYISKLKPKHKLFGEYMYNMDKNVFVVFKEDIAVFYIFYKKEGKAMKITNVENISNIRDLSFKIYSAILHLKIFDEIFTGEVLSTKNINAHKKYLSKNLNLYVNDEIIKSTKDFDKYFDTKHQFSLKDSGLIESILDAYNVLENKYTLCLLYTSPSPRD